MTEDYRKIVSDIMQLSISKFSKDVGLFVYLKGEKDLGFIDNMEIVSKASSQALTSSYELTDILAQSLFVYWDC